MYTYIHIYISSCNLCSGETSRCYIRGPFCQCTAPAHCAETTGLSGRCFYVSAWPCVTAWPVQAPGEGQSLLPAT